MDDAHSSPPLTRVGFPNAKINLGLQVRHRRPDGFHALESIFLPIPWCDTLEVETLPEDGPAQLVTGGIPIPGRTEDNLILRAHALLQEEFNLPAVRFHLIKSIPMGAGLGGGSANGAFALRLLDAHFGLGVAVDRLEEMSAGLGSDCPFFIRNTPALVTGRGEHVRPIHLDLDGWWLAVLHPGVHIPTAAAFGWIQPSEDRPGLAEWEGSGPDQWRGQLRNDFTEAVAARHPEVREALDLLEDRGATFSDMSGSGSAVFGWFPSDPGPAHLLIDKAHWRGWVGRL